MAMKFNRGLALVAMFAGLGVLTGCGQAAPKFEAEASGNKVTLFVTATAPDVCQIQTMFSYLKEGERKMAGNYCNDCKIPVGKHLELNSIEDAIIIEPKIESVKAECQSDNAGKASKK